MSQLATIISVQQWHLLCLSGFREHCCIKLYISSEIGLQSQKLSDCSEAEAERQKKNITAMQFIPETCCFHISLAWWQNQNDQYAEWKRVTNTN